MTNQKQDTSDKSASSYDRVSERVSSAYETARDRAGGAVQSLEANPLLALIGGLAVGAIAGALIPRSERERAALAPLGARLADTARAAFDAARTSGQQSFADAGFSTDQLRQQVNKLVEQALSAAGQAGTSAVAAARDSTGR